MLLLRDTYRELIDGELAGRDEKRLAEDRGRLNRFYDSFVRAHGYLHEPRIIKTMDDDPDLPFVLSLEKWDRKAKKGSKADIFSKATVAAVKPLTHVDNTKDAMLASLAEKGKIDMRRMTQLTGKTPHEVLTDLKSQD